MENVLKDRNGNVITTDFKEPLTADEYWKSVIESMQRIIKRAHKEGFDRGLLAGEHAYGNAIYIEELCAYIKPSAELLERFIADIKAEDKERTVTA